MEQKIVLSEEEWKIDYSELLFKKPAEPDPEGMRAIFGGPAEPDQIISIQNRNDILLPERPEVKNGYTRKPDGSGAVVTTVEMPGVTPEMIIWWFAWHGLKDLRYRIWCPEKHYAILVYELDLARRLDDSIPLKERPWGTTDVVTEDVGAGPKTMHLSFLSPEAYGYDPELVKNADALISAVVSDPDTGMRLITFSHCVRRIPGGIEYCSHYWQGYSIDDEGQAYAASVPEGGFPMEVMLGNAMHSLEEYANLAEILPGLYEKYGKEKDLMRDLHKK